MKLNFVIESSGDHPEWKRYFDQYER